MFIHFLKTQLKEEALQNELQIMRLALLKSNSCPCNGYSSKGGGGATNSEDAVKLIFTFEFKSIFKNFMF